MKHRKFPYVFLTIVSFSQLSVCQETTNTHSHPYDIGYDFNFESIFGICHDSTRHWSWTWARINRYSHCETEWIRGWTTLGMNITNFAFFQLTTKKSLSWGPFSVTSQPLKTSKPWGIFNVEPIQKKTVFSKYVLKILK